MTNFYLRLFTIAGLCLLLSCIERKTENEMPSILPEGMISYKERDYPLDSVSLKSYYIFSCYEGQFYGYNSATHSIDIFSVDSEIEHVILSKEGVNGILRGVSSMYVHRPDSIFLVSNGIIYQIDTNAKVENRINVTELLSKSGRTANMIFLAMNDYSTATVSLYYNNNRRSLWGLLKNPKVGDQFSVCEIGIETGSVKLFDLDVSPYFSENKGKFGWMELPNVTFSDSMIYYNYPVESDVYTLNIETLERNHYKAASRFINNKVDLCNGNTFEEGERHKINNSHFFELIFDPHRHLVYRLQLGGYPYDDKESMVSAYSHKTLCLSLFDSEMNYMGEVELGKDLYNYATSWCVGKEGLFLTKDNVHNVKNDFEKLELMNISIAPQQD